MWLSSTSNAEDISHPQITRGSCETCVRCLLPGVLRLLGPIASGRGCMLEQTGLAARAYVMSSHFAYLIKPSAFDVADAKAISRLVGPGKFRELVEGLIHSRQYVFVGQRRSLQVSFLDLSVFRRSAMDCSSKATNFRVSNRNRQRPSSGIGGSTRASHGPTESSEQAVWVS